MSCKDTVKINFNKMKTNPILLISESALLPQNDSHDTSKDTERVNATEATITGKEHSVLNEQESK